MGVNPQNLINEINDIGPYHGNLINNDEFNVVKQLAMVGRIFQKTMQFSSFQTEFGSSGSKGWNGSLKKLWRVLPPALMAAIPVGARTTYFFW